MEQAKIKVLELLEQGKVTPEQAVQLLEAMQDYSGAMLDFDAFEGDDLGDKIREFGANVEEFAKDCGSKIEDAYKEVEPKLKKAGITVLTKTAEVISEIAKALNESVERARAEEPKAPEAETEDKPADN